MIMVSWVTLIRRRNLATPKTGLHLPSSRFEIKIQMEEHTYVVKFLLDSSAKESKKNLPSGIRTISPYYYLRRSNSSVERENMNVRLDKQTRTGCWFGMAESACFFWDLESETLQLYTRSPQRLPKYSSIASHSRNGVSLWHYSQLKLSPLTWQKVCVCMLPNVDLYLDQTLLVLLQSLTSSIRMQLWFH